MKKKRIIDYFTQAFKIRVKKNTVIYGQNITTGSRVIGLTNNIENIKGVELINTQNSESSLIGFGLGLALSGKSSVYFVKQLDFVLLGADQIVNSVNSIMLEKIKNSFTIFTYIVDSGYEGPQSRFHCFQEFASFSNINCRYLIFPQDIKENISKMNKNKFNLFCLSQKFSKQNILPDCSYISDDKDVYRYNKGKNYTFIAMGFSSYYVLNFLKSSKKFIETDFFVVTNPLFNDFEEITKSARKTGIVHLFDDSRSKVKKMTELERYLRKKIPNIKIKSHYRNENRKSIFVNSDEFILDNF